MTLKDSTRRCMLLTPGTFKREVGREGEPDNPVSWKFNKENTILSYNIDSS